MTKVIIAIVVTIVVLVVWQISIIAAIIAAIIGVAVLAKGGKPPMRMCPFREPLGKCQLGSVPPEKSGASNAEAWAFKYCNGACINDVVEKSMEELRNVERQTGIKLKAEYPKDTTKLYNWHFCENIVFGIQRGEIRVDPKTGDLSN